MGISIIGMLCELLEHPDFSRWMTDLEICVDGLVSDRIRDMNAMVEATRRNWKSDTMPMQRT